MKPKVVFIGKKKFEKKIQNGQLKIAQYFSEKFRRLVLWLVELIDTNSIGLAQPIWS